MPTHHPREPLPRLDALRALCFLSVFLFHSFHTERPELEGHPARLFLRYTVFGNGGSGVNVFFVLSGFLITYLLFDERLRNQRIDVVRFWFRRMLRIWPLYFACVLFGFVVFPFLKHLAGMPYHGTADPFHYLFFISNFDTVDPDASNLRVLWSIAVEEQFYMLWPLLLIATPFRRSPHVFLSVILLSMAIRLWPPEGWDLNRHTLTCMGDLAMGGLAAWWACVPELRQRVQRWRTGTVIGIHAAFLGLFFLGSELEQHVPFGPVFHAPAFAAFAAAIILHQSFGTGTLLLLPSNGVLAHLGRISYGLYCLHPIAAMIVVQGARLAGHDIHLWQVILLQPLLSLIITWVLAEISFRYWEGPFLKLKERFASTPTATVKRTA